MGIDIITDYKLLTHRTLIPKIRLYYQHILLLMNALTIYKIIIILLMESDAPVLLEHLHYEHKTQITSHKTLYVICLENMHAA